MNVLPIVASLLDALFPPQTTGRYTSLIDQLLHGLKTPHPAHYDAILASLSSTSLFSYADPASRALVKALKYEGRKDVVSWIALQAAELLRHELSEKYLLEQKPTLIIPIPLTKKRFIERGFNQSALIARAIADKLPKITEYDDTLLKRIDFDQSQTKARTRKERAKNIQGAFTITDSESIRDRDVLIVDDVITTGSTIREAMRVLQDTGARSVSGFSVAH